jgi:hypothetical protein
MSTRPNEAASWALSGLASCPIVRREPNDKSLLTRLPFALDTGVSFIPCERQQLIRADPKPHRVGCIDLEIKVEHQTFGTFHHKLWRKLTIESLPQGAHRTEC